MKELETSNAERYLLSRFICCGEIASVEIGKNTPYSKSYIVEQAKKMRENGYIYRFKYSDQRTFYRLKQKGIDRIRELFGEDAASHVELLLGKNRYGGTKVLKLRQRKIYEAAYYFHSSGFSIDLYQNDTNPKKNRFGNGKKCCNEESEENAEEKSEGIFKGTVLRTMPEILKQIHPEDYVYLTSRAFRNITDAEYQLHPRTIMFRSNGLMIHNDSVYGIYWMNGPYEQWMREVEMQYASQVQRLTNNFLSGLKNKRSNLTKAIFLLPDTDAYTEFVLQESKRVIMHPDDIFNLAYVLPRSENAKDIISMLLVPHWRQAVNRLMIPELEEHGLSEDGYITQDDEKIPVYNFLCSNIRLMHRMAPVILSKKAAAIIIHDWQIDAAEKLFGTNAMQFIVTEEQFQTLLTDVKREMGITQVSL